jgi:uncharacterized membrane protein
MAILLMIVCEVLARVSFTCHPMPSAPQLALMRCPAVLLELWQKLAASADKGRVFSFIVGRAP